MIIGVAISNIYIYYLNWLEMIIGVAISNIYIYCLSCLVLIIGVAISNIYILFKLFSIDYWCTNK